MIVILKYIIIGILLFFLVLIIRTLRFKPLKRDDVELFEVNLDEANILKTFIEMIQCKTVSYKDIKLENEEEFTKFRKLLKGKYPSFPFYNFIKVFKSP